MPEQSRLEAVADLLRDQVSPRGIDQYYAETGVCQEDFILIKPRHFKGHIFAVDGSNMVVCSWSVANLNWIRAGYVVYRGSEWQRTVITFDDVFLADPQEYSGQFNSYLRGIFGLEAMNLEEAELERLSTYFRELQEYIALLHALRSASPGDLVLYDGGFALWKSRLLAGILPVIFDEAEEKEVDLLGVSKSSAFSWGQGFSRPFVHNTSLVGSRIAPGNPWYLCLSGKNIHPNAEGWDGKIYVVRFVGESDCAFRVDAPSFVADHIDRTLEKLVYCACSSECHGYPHALFRAHREIRITEQESEAQRMELIDLLAERGLTESKLRSLLLDYHDLVEMRSRGII